MTKTHVLFPRRCRNLHIGLVLTSDEHKKITVYCSQLDYHPNINPNPFRNYCRGIHWLVLRLLDWLSRSYYFLIYLHWHWPKFWLLLVSHIVQLCYKIGHFEFWGLEMAEWENVVTQYDKRCYTLITILQWLHEYSFNGSSCTMSWMRQVSCNLVS